MPEKCIFRAFLLFFALVFDLVSVQIADHDLRLRQYSDVVTDPAVVSKRKSRVILSVELDLKCRRESQRIVEEHGDDLIILHLVLGDVSVGIGQGCLKAEK